MAGFCRNCGSPLADGQGFCTACGTRVGDVAAKSAAVPPAAAPPPAAPPQAAAPVYATPPAQAAPIAVAPARTEMSPLIKILIAIVITFVAFGAFASIALIYIGHRVHEKATELGLNRPDGEQRASDAELRRIDGCKLLPKSAVSAAVHMDIVRAENDGGDPGCAYSVAGDPADMTAKHITAMHKSEMSQQQQNNVQDFAKSIFKSGNTSGPSEHPGEAPVLVYSIDNNAAQLQMKLNRATLGRLGPVGLVAIPGLGDEAFDAYGAMLFVRKGDKLVRIIYMGCPCAQEDVLPLAQTIVAGL
ncbi:MAG TPA: zinc ribbon domain-containing protein [Candidatus Eremiobacteraceae bacterium]|nr:zinc ribbon domain-containing protein [Candidatus Eremiobacteraceae bacterium]